MRGTGIGTSLILIAAGAVLAFGVNANTSGVDINAIGIILLLVGVLGMIISFAFLEGWSFAGPSRAVYRDDYDEGVSPHEHRRVQTRDVVYEDDRGDQYVERERRISH
jgi:hypothetical protein